MRGDDASLVLQGQIAVQPFQDLNRSASIAGTFRLGQQLQGMQLELHGVVPGDLPAVLEAEDTVQAYIQRQWSVSGLRALRRNGEACVEARQEALQHAVSFRDGGRASQSKFRHQPVLKRFRRSLHAALGLGRQCEYHPDPQLVHGAAELGRRTGKPRPGRVLEDGVPVDVEGNRRAVVLHQLLRQQEVVEAVFVLAEHGVDHSAGSVIHRQQQRELQSRLPQPSVIAAVHLDQHPRLRHPLATNPMLGRTATARAVQPGGNQYASQRTAVDVDTLALSKQFAQVGVVGSAVAGAGQV